MCEYRAFYKKVKETRAKNNMIMSFFYIENRNHSIDNMKMVEKSYHG